ncbi:cold-shock protein [Arsenicicoccus piscis]|uniref:Cold-shock protein CspA n=1 Tax=Arsenicicoccus piscis TaxID=673954 RepID=A0ABQ6HRC1_9MICO|nr:cold-shock protein [Arsenicicoccus piscis]MCH8627956.1 cold-shock protein [Arsenicicoccus piscis]GMA20707.1 cold-shock protein CspA [Arsenicicoccus piscis]
MPTGKVKWYDAEKGFGFLSDDEGNDVFCRASALPDGVTTLKAGTRVEFGVIAGRKGAQALDVIVLDKAPSVATAQHAKHRKPAEEMVPIIEDVMQLLDAASTSLRRGKYPEPAHARKIAAVLRAIAHDFDGER